MIKAIGMDLDGTVYPHRRMILNSIPFFFRHPLIASDFIKLRKTVRTFDKIPDFKIFQAEILSAKRHIPLDKANMLIEKYFYTEWEDVISRIKPYPSVFPFLEKIKSLQIKTGIMSDFPPAKKLSRMKLDKYFDFAFCAEESGYLKPHSKPFELLSSKLGEKAEDILYIGNSRRMDIQGAKAFGMQTAYLGSSQCPEADYIFKNYQDLFNMISKKLSH